jgi:hypothetical protein
MTVHPTPVAFPPPEPSHFPANFRSCKLFTKRSFLGWIVAAAAAVVTVGTVEMASSVSGGGKTRSELARQGTGVPPGLLVVVSDGGKLFPIPESSVIHDRAHLRTLAAREAEHQGFVPCVRCRKQ